MQAKAAARVLPRARNVHLTALTIRANSLMNAHLDILLPAISQLANLRILDLAENKITAAGAEALTGLFGAMCPLAIHELDLSYNHLGDRGVAAIAAGLKFDPDIRVLKLDKVFFVPHNMIVC